MEFIVKVIIEVVSGAPIWVWALLVFLCLLGCSRLRDTKVTTLRLLLPSIIFIGLASIKLIATHLPPAALAGACLGLLLGAGSVFLVRPQRRTALLPDGRILIAGEWHSLALMLLLFAVNYAHAVMAAVAPVLAAAPGVVLANALLNFSGSGFMLARSLAHLRKVADLGQGPQAG